MSNAVISVGKGKKSRNIKFRLIECVEQFKMIEIMSKNIDPAPMNTRMSDIFSYVLFLFAWND